MSAITYVLFSAGALVLSGCLALWQANVLRRRRTFCDNLRRELEGSEAPVPPKLEALSAVCAQPVVVSKWEDSGALLSCKWKMRGCVKARYKLTRYEKGRRIVSGVRDYLDTSDGTVLVAEGATDFTSVKGTFVLEDSEPLPRDSDNGGTRFRLTLIVSGNKVQSWVTDRFSRVGNLYRIAPLYSASSVLVLGTCIVEEACE